MNYFGNVTRQQVINANKDQSFVEYACVCRKPKHFLHGQANLVATCPRGNNFEQVRELTIEEYFYSYFKKESPDDRN